MRNPITYRSERRNDWRELDGVTWQEHNKRGAPDPWHIGSVQSQKVTMRPRKIGRSKYMPHESIKRGGFGPVFA